MGWPSDGLVIYGDRGVSSYEPDVATDDAGGAIVLWYDFRSGSSNPDVRAQRVTPTGALSPGWPAGGVAVTLDPGYQYSPVACADGARTGAWVVWIDARGGGDDIYGQHISDTGTLLPADVPVAVAARRARAPAIVADGSGGAIIAWEDARPFLRDIFAQHVLANGNLVWAPGGIALSDASGGSSPSRSRPTAQGRDRRVERLPRRRWRRCTRPTSTPRSAPVGGWTVDGSPVCAITGSQRDRASPATARVARGSRGTITAAATMTSTPRTGAAPASPSPASTPPATWCAACLALRTFRESCPAARRA